VDTSNSGVIWLGILSSVAAVLVAIGWVVVRLGNVRAEKAELELKAFKEMRTEVATTVMSAITPNDLLKILYVGNNFKDQLEMIRVFRVAGIRNQVVALDGIQAGFMYLKEHSSTLFAIIYVTDIKKGTDFLELVMGDDVTKGMTVFFIDGNDPATALAAYEGGGAGVLKSPLEWTALLGFMNKAGLALTIEKVR